MAEPTIKNRLESGLFTNNKPDVQARLDACLNNDAYHIKYGDNYPAISTIQMALGQIRDLLKSDVPAITDPRGSFGSSTRAAVLYYKSHNTPPIIRAGAALDPIVGRMTITALDNDIMAIEGKRSEPVTPVVAEKPLDIFILFSGAPNIAVQGTADTDAEADFQRNLNTEIYQATHQSAVSFCRFGGRDATDRSAEAAQVAIAARNRTKTGVIVIVGVSIGAFPALNTAQLLTKQGIRVDYLAIEDGAYFDGNGDISSFSPLTIRLPGSIIATKKDNFFQAWGHELLATPDGRGGFMNGAEFHAALGNGFNDFDMKNSSNTRAVIDEAEKIPGLRKVPLGLKIRQHYATQAHVAAVKDADQKVNLVVKELIKP